jgi:hypothetical protein
MMAQEKHLHSMPIIKGVRPNNPTRVNHLSPPYSLCVREFNLLMVTWHLTYVRSQKIISGFHQCGVASPGLISRWNINLDSKWLFDFVFFMRNYIAFLFKIAPASLRCFEGHILSHWRPIWCTAYRPVSELKEYPFYIHTLLGRVPALRQLQCICGNAKRGDTWRFPYVSSYRGYTRSK